MSRDLRVHYGGTWEEIILGTVRGHDYKGGIFRDKLGIHFEDVVSYQKLLEIVYKCFPEIDGRICSFYYMTGTVRLLVVSDDDLKFMWKNIAPLNDGFTHLYVNLYLLSPPYIHSLEMPSQTSCVINLDSPAKNTRSATKLANNSPAKNTRSSTKLTSFNLSMKNISPTNKLPVKRRLDDGVSSPSRFSKLIEYEFFFNICDTSYLLFINIHKCRA